MRCGRTPSRRGPVRCLCEATALGLRIRALRGELSDGPNEAAPPSTWSSRRARRPTRRRYGSRSGRVGVRPRGRASDRARPSLLDEGRAPRRGSPRGESRRSSRQAGIDVRYVTSARIGSMAMATALDLSDAPIGPCFGRWRSDRPARCHLSPRTRDTGFWVTRAEAFASIAAFAVRERERGSRSSRTTPPISSRSISTTHGARRNELRLGGQRPRGPHGRVGNQRPPPGRNALSRDCPRRLGTPLRHPESRRRRGVASPRDRACGLRRGGRSCLRYLRRGDDESPLR